MDVIGTADGVGLRTAGVPSRLDLAAGGGGGAAGLAVGTEGDGGARLRQGDGGSSVPAPREQPEGLQVGADRTRQTHALLQVTVVVWK